MNQTIHLKIYQSLFFGFLLLFCLPSLGQTNATVLSPEEILLRAFKNIADNYPTTNTTYTVLYHENIASDNADYQSNYEAILSINRTPYTLRKREESLVLNIASILDRTDSIDHQVAILSAAYPPPVSPLQADFVFRQSPFIHPKHFDRFHYQLDSITLIHSTPCYAIHFKEREGGKTFIDGTLYIDTCHYAYVKGRFWYPRPNSIYSERGFYTQDHRYGGTQIEISYQKEKKYWHLKEINYLIDNLECNRSLPLKTTIHYSTLQITDSSQKASPNKNPIKENELGQTPPPPVKEKQQPQQKVWYALHTGIRPTTLKGSGTPFFLQSSQGTPLAVSSPRANTSPVHWLIGDEAAIGLFGHWQLIGKNTFSFLSKDWSVTSDFLINYHLNFRSDRVPALDLAIGYSWQKNRCFLQQIENPDPEHLLLHQKRFDSRELDIYAYSKLRGFTPQITLSQYFGKSISGFISCAYLIPTQRKNYIQVKEHSGRRIKRKSINENIHKLSELQPDTPLPTLHRSEWSITTGIRILL